MDKVALVELPVYVESVLTRLPDADGVATIIALRGELGSGKTTFVQGLARAVGVTNIVQSPTYVLMKSYDISYKKFTKLIHIDAYRLNDPEEFKTLQPEKFLKDPHNLVCVEWPERVGKLLPIPDMVISFSADNASEGERFITIL